nr:MarR family winged helix-turn-helix transcriptional regulator [uncultured Clostridium sp.]
MGDKKSDSLHCPCCKRHCPLEDLHCSKGKVYAKSIKSKETAIQQQKETYAPSYNRILLSYKIGFDRLFGKREHGHGGKKTRVLVMGALFQADQKTVMELEADISINSDKLMECLEKLDKKEYIIKKKDPEGVYRYSLSEKGLKAAEESIKDGDREVLSRLNEEERDQLERLLKKLLP